MNAAEAAGVAVELLERGDRRRVLAVDVVDGPELGQGVVDALDAARQDDIGDDLLRLMFTACHPVLPPDALVEREDAILADTTLPPELRDALEQALAGWRAVECHPASISVPQPGQ